MGAPAFSCGYIVTVDGKADWDLDMNDVDEPMDYIVLNKTCMELQRRTVF